MVATDQPWASEARQNPLAGLGAGRGGVLVDEFEFAAKVADTALFVNRLTFGTAVLGGLGMALAGYWWKEGDRVHGGLTGTIALAFILIAWYAH